jgi:hypothetical protein
MDFSFTDDQSLPDCPFNYDLAQEAAEMPCYDGSLYLYTRERSNVKWGTISSHWESSSDNLNQPGTKYDTYDLLDAGFMARENSMANKDLPLIFALSGITDVGMGWDEKIPVYDSMNAYRQGGVFLWDPGAHQNFQYWNWDGSFPLDDLIRYSTKQAYLGFSDCSINGDPLTESSGNINGFFNWDETTMVDQRQPLA